MDEKKFNFQEAKQILSLIDSKKDFSKQEVEQIQSYLKSAGYNLGNTGKNKDGVDGDWGNKTTSAVNQLRSDFNTRYSKDNSKDNSSQSTKTYNHTAESFVPMESIGAYNIGQVMGNAFKKSKPEETNPYKGMSAEELIATNPKLMQQLLMAEKYDLGEWKDDGKWGNTSKKAWAQAQKDGWVLKDGKLIKPNPVDSSNSFYNTTYFLSEDDSPIKVNWNNDKAKVSAKIGHAANLVIDDNGNVSIYEYGRYGGGKGKPGYYYTTPEIKDGKTRNRGNVKYTKLPINAKNYLNEDGTLNEEALMQDVTEKHFSSGSMSYRKTNQSANETVSYWDAFGSNPDRDDYSGFGNNCVSTAARFSGAVERPMGSVPGNEGFWIPRQAQSVVNYDFGGSKGNVGNANFSGWDVASWATPGIIQSTVDNIKNKIFLGKTLAKSIINS